MFSRRTFGIAALAAAALLLESTLVRFLAVAQYYHFAFLVVSLALLGFGASGSILALISRFYSPVNTPFNNNRDLSEQILPIAGIGFAFSVGLVYLVVNFIPFDSYSIAWERRQLLFFVLYFLVLTLPFLFTGLGIGAALMASVGRSHLVYAANLIGSGVGTVLALGALWLAGVPGAMLASALVGILAAYPVMSGRLQKWGRLITWATILIVTAVFVSITITNLDNRSLIGMTVSPYKGLAQAWQYPGSETIFKRWNAISRIDVIADAGTRMLPGLSYTYKGAPPPQFGISIDADSLQPISLIRPDEFKAASFMAEAIAFELRPDALVLVLEPSGGLGVLQALSGGANEIAAVISNPLVRQAVKTTTTPRTDIYAQPGVRTVHETPRVYLQKDSSVFDVVYYPLTDTYRPVTSGAYSLSETYDLTVEAFEDMLARLGPDGILVSTRWLQVPPSESVRLIATIATALERRYSVKPVDAILAYRGIQTMTVLVKPDGWHSSELLQVREFTKNRRYDLVWAPDILPEETNRYNILPESSYYLVVRDILATEDRAGYYANYLYSIFPPTDDHPFFFHFFKWEQTPELLATLGKTWQPFGGSGYFVLMALLVVVSFFSLVLILVPVVYLRYLHRRAPNIETRKENFHNLKIKRWQVLAYFGLLGLAFLFVEIPLIQRSILLLGHPIYAFSIVVLALLTFSGLGSLLVRSHWLPKKWVFIVLVVLALLTPVFFRLLTIGALSWPFVLRVLIVVFSLAPLSILMGMPFPMGLIWLEKLICWAGNEYLVPWAWAINGCASVISAVLAAILALSYGFTVVFLAGAIAYALAGLIYLKIRQENFTTW